MSNQFKFSQLTPEQIEKFDLLTDILRREAKIHNLTRITEPEEVRLKHFCDSLACFDLLKAEIADHGKLRLLDVGSGAGFPSLAIAIAMEDVQIISMDATGKKVRFQQTAADELGLDNFKVIHTRAEELAHVNGYREQFDIVTARAVSSMAMLAELCLPFLKTGGKMLAWKGPKATEELATAKEGIKQLGGKVEARQSYSLKEIGESETEDTAKLEIVVIKKTKETPTKYPREYKTIKTNPL